MNVITEAFLKEEMKNGRPDTYYLPKGSLLSPSARDYLSQYKIKVENGTPPAPPKETVIEKEIPKVEPKANYVDYATGAFYEKKPEYMTQLVGNILIPKNHPRIYFRGKLDSLQALIIRNQTSIAKNGKREKLLKDLENILQILQNIMRCDVLDEPFSMDLIIGLTHEELRAHSHNPMKFYQIKQMIMPHYTMGEEYAILNQIRTAIRECEISAVDAYQEGNRYTHEGILEEFNRLSSALHIMMCKYLAGHYK